MPSGERRAPGAIDPAPDVNAELSSVNAVFTLSLILTQASSPVQLIRLVTTAIPSIARCQRVLAWHPFSAGEYYERAPDGIGDALAALTEPGPLDLGHGTVLIGMGERTTPMAAEILARALFASGQARTVTTTELPKSHAMMHLDTVMTMIDRSTFVLYPYIDRHFRSWTITPDGEDLKVTHNHSLWDALPAALGVDAVTVLVTDEDIRAAEREQWDDGNNYLAVAPGVILGYDRNVATNTMLRKHGIEVIEVPGSGGRRGRDGPRCMTCPIQRDPADPD